MNEEIVAQGNKVRDLKSSKAPKAAIDAEVKILLNLKDKYKSLTGENFKPTTTSATPSACSATKSELNPNTNSKIDSLFAEIQAQGDVVRGLKAKKADSTTITKEVSKLLELKNEFKKESGQEWSPAFRKDSSTATKMSEKDKEMKMEQLIIEQGNVVRDLKSKKADKDSIQQEVQTLLDLKAEYKKTFGKEYSPAGGNAPREPKAKAGKSENKQNKSSKKQEIVKEADISKTGTRLGLEAKKGENLPDWYSQVITKGEMIEYYDVSGCYILRPWSYGIWDIIKDFFDREIKKLGVQNCYFPIFVSKSALEREKDHIADFAPEVAWVTKSGDSDLAEHIAIRPTSETVMYPAYAKWLKSHRDLPLKLNQWNNVVVS